MQVLNIYWNTKIIIFRVLMEGAKNYQENSIMIEDLEEEIDDIDHKLDTLITTSSNHSSLDEKDV